MNKTLESMINCTALAAEIEAWKADFLAHTAEVCGEYSAEASAAELEADPSLALEYFLEDQINSIQAARMEREAGEGPVDNWTNGTQPVDQPARTLVNSACY